MDELGELEGPLHEFINWRGDGQNQGFKDYWMEEWKNPWITGLKDGRKNS